MTALDKSSDVVRGVTAGEAFTYIRAAVEGGHAVIPVLGSGMSVAAGFPLAADLCNYLVRLRWWLSLTNRGSVASFLRSHHWPSRHDLTADLLVKVCAAKREGDELTKKFNSAWPEVFTDLLEHEEFNLNRDAIFDELRRDAPTAAYALQNIFHKMSEFAMKDKLTEFAAGDTKQTLQELYNEATGKIHNYTGYRSLLNYLCDRDGDLIDAFFDHFARDLRLSTTHQFIAFAAQLLGCRLILTTNFDTFVETALREEGMRPSVYEIGREGSPPSAQLVHSQHLSVVKLHGGAFSLRTGFDLDERLTPGVLAQYREFFRPAGPHAKPPLVLALGYSGSDRRVMDILSTHLLDWTPKTAGRHSVRISGENRPLPRIVWVSRDGTVPINLAEIVRPYARPLSSSPAIMCSYRDGGHFLHELYQTITDQHPVGRQHYRALTAIARTPNWNDGYFQEEPADQDKKAKEKRTKVSADSKPQDVVRYRSTFIKSMRKRRGMLFHADGPFGGSSSVMAKACHCLEKTHTTIWVDAAEVRSRASLFMIIEKYFHPYDNNLIRVTRPLLCCDVDYFKRDSAIKPGSHTPETWAEQWELDVAVRWIANALRRGRYTLAIDSLGEFASGHPALWHPLRAPGGPPCRSLDGDVNEQIQKVFAFAGRLISREHDIGESKILMTLVSDDQKRCEDELFGPAKASGFNVCQLTSPEPMSDKRLRRFKKLFSPTAKDDELVRAMVVVLASFGRRGRSHASLVTLIQRVMREVNAHRHELTVEFRRMADAYMSPNTWFKDEKPTDARRAASAVRQAVEAESTDALDLLSREEGGFYSMHQSTRDDIFRYVCDSGLLRLEQIALVFDGLADFYHDDVYERSQDAAAFMEYFFHRLMSIRWEPATSEASRKRRYDRAVWLTSAIELEREKLLARGRQSALLNHLRTFLVLLVDLACKDHPSGNENANRDYVVLISRLLSSYADLLLSTGHAADALGYRALQVRVLEHRWEAAQAGRSASTGFEAAWTKWAASIATFANTGFSADPREIAAVLESLVEIDGKLREEIGKLCGDRTPDCRNVVAYARDVVDLMIDFAVTLGDPMLFDSDAHLTLEDTKRVWETHSARAVRRKYVFDLFQYAEKRAEQLCWLAASRVDIERLTRARVRHYEHKLRLMDHRLSRLLDAGGRPAESTEIEKLVRDCKLALDEIRSGPDSSKRRRHKCYLYLTIARAFSLQRNFEEADVHFRRALSSLARSAGAAERSAMAVVYLCHAEMLLAQVVESSDQLPLHDEGATRIAVSQHLQNSELLLRQAFISLENEARTENRWRTYYNFLSAKLALAKIDSVEMSDEARDDLLFTAMRHVTAGATNSGFRSDRRLVFHAMMREVCGKIIKLEPLFATKVAGASAVEVNAVLSASTRAEAEEEEQSVKADEKDLRSKNIKGQLDDADLLELARRAKARSKIRAMRERVGISRIRGKKDLEFFNAFVEPNLGPMTQVSEKVVRRAPRVAPANRVKKRG